MQENEAIQTEEQEPTEVVELEEEVKNPNLNSQPLLSKTSLKKRQRPMQSKTSWRITPRMFRKESLL